MAHQVVGRLHTSPCVKVGKGDPVCGVGFQRPVKELEIVEAEGVLNWFLLDRGYQEVSFVLDTGTSHPVWLSLGALEWNPQNRISHKYSLTELSSKSLLLPFVLRKMKKKGKQTIGNRNSWAVAGVEACRTVLRLQRLQFGRTRMLVRVSQNVRCRLAQHGTVYVV